MRLCSNWQIRVQNKWGWVGQSVCNRLAFHVCFWRMKCCGNARDQHFSELSKGNSVVLVKRSGLDSHRPEESSYSSLERRHSFQKNSKQGSANLVNLSCHIRSIWISVHNAAVLSMRKFWTSLHQILITSRRLLRIHQRPTLTWPQSPARLLSSLLPLSPGQYLCKAKCTNNNVHISFCTRLPCASQSKFELVSTSQDRKTEFSMDCY